MLTLKVRMGSLGIKGEKPEAWCSGVNSINYYLANVQLRSRVPYTQRDRGLNGICYVPLSSGPNWEILT